LEALEEALAAVPEGRPLAEKIAGLRKKLEKKEDMSRKQE